ncbi:YjjG family noncanonical pyrimidine nucleotidase [Chitinimonas sp.]|uniref:YjjG family noncanonical pyrimidine nucleotidase n=1 Tax=Chitinimonas sp. TaxID=1934313 RepID=UPI0035AF37FB
MAERYDWLLFDADDTLYDFRLAEHTALSATLLEHYGRVEPYWLSHYHGINKRLFAELERGEITMAELRPRRFREWLDHHTLEGDPQALSAAYLDQLCQQAQLIDGTEAVLAALHGRFKLAIVTNGFTRAQRSRFALSSLHRYFDALFISEEIGAFKPHAAYFDAVFQALGHPTRERVMIIGDNPDTDIAGGLNYGIATCWLNRHGETSQHQPQHEIRQLDQLLELL